MSRINLKVVTRINLPILRFNALNASRSLLVIFTAHSIQSIRIHVIRVKTKHGDIEHISLKTSQLMSMVFIRAITSESSE